MTYWRPYSPEERALVGKIAVHVLHALMNSFTSAQFLLLFIQPSVRPHHNAAANDTTHEVNSKA